MQNLIVDKPVLRVDINNDRPYTHVFKGRNVSNLRLVQTSLTKGCSCTNLIFPTEIQPNEEFEIEMTVDKTSLTGLYAVSATIGYNDGTKLKLNLNGSIIDVLKIKKD